MTFEVLDAGLLTTVQDRGRTGFTHVGVPVGGACDPWSLAVANALVDAPSGAPALEATVIGPTLRAAASTVIGLGGADLGGVEMETGRRLLPGRSYRIEAGRTIAFPGAPDRALPGTRAYVAVPGGIAAPSVLGSASTLVSAGLGGVGGRAIAPGDRIDCGAGSASDSGSRIWPGPAIAPGTGEPLRIVAGPAPGIGALVGVDWAVEASSDRTGARLGGGRVATDGSPILSHGVVDGAIQAPPDGRPIVLLPDHGTTGGYPVIAVVITADLAAAGQLGPGDRLRFVEVTEQEARVALAARHATWAAAVRTLREAATWDDLWHSAGG